MTTFAVARILRGQPRFFTGGYVGNQTVPIPITTGAPDEAKSYYDKNIVRLRCLPRPVGLRENDGFDLCAEQDAHHPDRSSRDTPRLPS